jgi:hypothetical protein
VRVVHEGQGLALGLEAGHNLAGIHAGLEDLERDLAAHRLGLVSHEDQPHAARTDLLQQLVRPDHRAGALDGGLAGARRQANRRAVEWSLRPGVAAQEGLHAPPQRFVIPAGRVQVSGPLVGRVDLQGGVENRFFVGGRLRHVAVSSSMRTTINA